MSTLSRSDPETRVRELTRQLAEDYDRVPLPEVSRVVREATAAAIGDDEWSGTPNGVASIIEVIEQVAREDLDEVQRGNGS